jgi:hypothetical protein
LESKGDVSIHTDTHTQETATKRHICQRETFLRLLRQLPALTTIGPQTSADHPFAHTETLTAPHKYLEELVGYAMAHLHRDAQPPRQTQPNIDTSFQPHPHDITHLHLTIGVDDIARQRNRLKAHPSRLALSLARGYLSGLQRVSVCVGRLVDTYGKQANTYRRNLR